MHKFGLPRKCSLLLGEFVFCLLELHDDDFLLSNPSRSMFMLCLKALYVAQAVVAVFARYLYVFSGINMQIQSLEQVRCSYSE